VIESGPAFKGELTRYKRGTIDQFRFRVIGKAGEGVTLYKDKQRPKPVFVIRDQDGKEVLRKACAFG
jgi:hypothetical protein